MNFELLLSQISTVNKRYEEISKISGENFNIFNLLDLSHNEMSHSKIIASLLDTKGTHGMGNTFLKSFLSDIEIDDFPTDNVSVETEKSIGRVSDDSSSGGRIDIALTDRNNPLRQIFIENKIYAGDQSNQLSRYHKYNPQASLLYLTLDGTEPSEYSIKEDDGYRTISYRDDILNWLELCRKEAVSNPLLRETLTQYIALIKQLTGQARSKDMENEYLDIILRDADNLSAAYVILENQDKIEMRIIKDKFEPLLLELAAEFGLSCEIDPFEDFLKIYWEFDFYKKEWDGIRICFVFQARNMRKLSYGVYDNGEVIHKEFDRYLRELDYESSENWPLHRDMDSYRDWDKKFFLDLFSEFERKKVHDVFKNKIEEMSTIIADMLDTKDG
jgi:hypothetical protein